MGTQNIYEDQLKEITIQSDKFRKNLQYIDYSLFLDGLLEEKTQGITIDLAFKYFKFQNKDFIINNREETVKESIVRKITKE